MMKNARTKRTLLMLLIGLVLIFTAACNNTDDAGANNNQNGSDENVNENNNGEDDKDVEEDVVDDVEKEPVTILLASPLGEQLLEGRWGPVRDALPEHINLEYIPYWGSVEQLEELFAAEVYPDIFVANYGPIEQLGVDYGLDELIEQNDFDLDILDSSLNSYIRSLDDDGRYIGFPDGMTYWGMYYNKDVFDTLGFEYPDPEVPMTWDELMKLARDMTVKVGETQYYGLTGTIGAALAQFAVNATDAETGEVRVDSDPAFQRHFELLDTYYSIPGVAEIEGNPFVETLNVAMHIEANNWLDRGWGWPDPEYVENIDLVPIPVWSDMPTTTPGKNAWAMMIADYSENKQEAFEVLTTYLSEEIQIEMAKTMMLQTPLNSPEVMSHYATEIPIYDGKNVQAYFFGEAAIHEETRSRWDEYVDINGAMNRLKTENIDVNTLLRELAEESALKIQDAKTAQ